MYSLRKIIVFKYILMPSIFFMNIFSVCEQKKIFFAYFLFVKIVKHEIAICQNKIFGKPFIFLPQFLFIFLFFSPSECLNLKVMFLKMFSIPFWTHTVTRITKQNGHILITVNLKKFYFSYHQISKF